jgi:hypothetical protein
MAVAPPGRRAGRLTEPALRTPVVHTAPREAA